MISSVYETDARAVRPGDVPPIAGAWRSLDSGWFACPESGTTPTRVRSLVDWRGGFRPRSMSGRRVFRDDASVHLSAARMSFNKRKRWWGSVGDGVKPNRS